MLARRSFPISALYKEANRTYFASGLPDYAVVVLYDLWLVKHLWDKAVRYDLPSGVAACRINSSSASRIGIAAAARSSHCVAAGKGIPSWPCSLSSRLNG